MRSVPRCPDWAKSIILTPFLSLTCCAMVGIDIWFYYAVASAPPPEQGFSDSAARLLNMMMMILFNVEEVTVYRTASNLP